MIFILYDLFIAIPVAVVFFIISTILSLLRLIKAKKTKEQLNSQEVNNDEKK